MGREMQALEDHKAAAKADVKHLARLLKKARAELSYEARREEEKTARWRRVGSALLASRPEGT